MADQSIPDTENYLHVPIDKYFELSLKYLETAEKYCALVDKYTDLNNLYLDAVDTIRIMEKEL